MQLFSPKESKKSKMPRPLEVIPLLRLVPADGGASPDLAAVIVEIGA
jgi:hypothetical protein